MKKINQTGEEKFLFYVISLVLVCFKEKNRSYFAMWQDFPSKFLELLEVSKSFFFLLFLMFLMGWKLNFSIAKENQA